MSTWDDKPNDYDHALAEIKRLRAENLHCQHQIEISRNTLIEECARTIETEIRMSNSHGDMRLIRYLAAVIRARKGNARLK